MTTVVIATEHDANYCKCATCQDARRKMLRPDAYQFDSDAYRDDDHTEVLVDNIKRNSEAHSDDLRGSVLLNAHKVINGERQDVYGSPEDSFELISRYWNLYLTKGSRIVNGPLKADDVAMMMVLFKIAREANQHKRDNVVDAAGYLGIYADMAQHGQD